MIDALGFKGIWKATTGAADLRVLQTLRTALETATLKRYLLKSLIPTNFAERFELEPTVHVSSLSDTLVIAAVAPSVEPGQSPDQDLPWGLVDLVCQCAAYVMRHAAQADRPLVYRGIVTVGPMLVDDTFLIGPAVDEASELMDLADGAFVWLSPSAAALTPRPYFPNVWSTMAVEYALPLKQRGALTTTLLSPYVDTGDRAERAKIRQGYEAAMASTRVDVAIKRQNTLRFLDHVDRVHPAMT